MSQGNEPRYWSAPQTNTRVVTITEFRRNLAHYINLVRYSQDFIRIARRGCDSVYLISEIDFDDAMRVADEIENGKLVPGKKYRDRKGWRWFFNAEYHYWRFWQREKEEREEKGSA